MRKKYLILLMIICPPLQASCTKQLLLSFIPSISINKKAFKVKREFPSKGQVAKSNEFKNLPPGRYVFLVDREGDVIWSPAIPDLTVNVKNESLPVIVTHRSLAAFQESRNKEQSLIAGGEFNIVQEKNGFTVQEVSNRSSTYPGNGASLDLAIHFLKKQGLNIDDKTVLSDYSKPGFVLDIHYTQEEAAIATLVYQNTPELKELKKIEELLVEKFPSKTMRRAIDIEKLEENLVELYEGHEKDPEVEKKLRTILMVLPHISTRGAPLTLQKLNSYNVRISDIYAALKISGIISETTTGSLETPS